MNEAEDKLLHAVADYVASIGGKAIVVGGIQISHWPGEKLNYRVSVKCTGKRPTKELAQQRLTQEQP